MRVWLSLLQTDACSGRVVDLDAVRRFSCAKLNYTSSLIVARPLGSSATMKPRTHPDSHELDDWPMYGPKDPEIANLVDRLAYDHGLRVYAIEQVILRALRDRVRAEEARVSQRTR